MAYSRSFVVVDAIGVAADAFAFGAVYDPNVVVFDPMGLELVDLSLSFSKELIKNKFMKMSNSYISMSQLPRVNSEN